jgi:hypothetical protein
MAVWSICTASWVPKATNAHPEFLIFIAFSLQQLLHERASILRVKYIATLLFLLKENFLNVPKI